MHYEELAPPPELGLLVHRIWLLRGARDATGAPFQRVMPDGRAELIFNLAQPFEARAGPVIGRQPTALLVGPNRRAMEIRPTGTVDLLGVRFRPEALAAWLRVSGRELVDGAFAVEELPIPLERTLPDQLVGEPDPGSRLAILRRHLSRAVAPDRFDRRLGAAVDMALAGGGVRPRAIAAAVGLSHRQLSRAFREHLGFGPKSLMRLGRFQRVLRALESPGRVPLAMAASRAGYFDQAHLARDFRLFAGTSPGRYLREARELARNFIAGPDGEFFQDPAR